MSRHASLESSAGRVGGVKASRLTRIRRRGLTLVEAMLCTAILGITAAAISGLFVSGLQSIEGNDAEMLIDSRLRSQMEELLSRPFADVLADGSGAKVVPVEAGTVTVNWSATLYDLDGDGVDELNAMMVTVAVAGSGSLSTLVVDHGDILVKI